MLTIKTLFGEATGCAYPDCAESLVFRDRGQVTVVAEIAHIRSELVGGPRYDDTFYGDINGSENLLLLCGKHHRPVDRHERVYSVQELERWKAQQRLLSTGGTKLTEADIKTFIGLNADERAVLMDVARKAQAVVHSTQAGVERVLSIWEANEQERLRLFARLGPTWSVNDDGTRLQTTHEGFSLAPVDQAQWNARAAEAWHQLLPRIDDAIGALSAELAVLRMLSPTYGQSANDILQSAVKLKACVDNPSAFTSAVQRLEVHVAQVWRVANGESVSEAARTNGGN